MQLPWWPCYVDARIDECGVYFDHDGAETLVPWHLVGRQGDFVVAYEEDGKRVRIGNKLVLLKIPNEVKKKFAAHQEQYLNNTELKFTCGVDQSGFSSNFRAMVFYLAFLLVFTPAMFLVVMIQGVMEAPDNEPGIRFQNATIASIIAIACLVVFFSWRTYRSAVQTHRAHKVASINNLGKLASNSDGLQSHYDWDQIKSVRQGFIGILVTSDSGEQLLFPLHSQAWLLARHMCKPSTATFRTGFLIVTLSLAVLSGPFFSLWHAYLIPDHEMPAHTPWLVSTVTTGMLLFIFSLYPIADLIEKRRVKKSK